MTQLRASVVIASRGRPGVLKTCLLGLSQQDFPHFELIVVADDASISAVDNAGLTDQVKTVSFSQPNIAAARNAGIDVAGGEVIAFIDDDAVPEPTWLSYLMAAFENPQVAAAGGFVIGRNGITFQWQGRMAFADGREVPMSVDLNHANVIKAEPGRAIKTEGTNMAFRRAVLDQIGGFDPAIAFYMDETDLNMRLAEIGAHTAVVPQAQVHHGYTQSPRRTANRVPLDLTDIGRSQAIYLRKHSGVAVIEMFRDDLRQEQRVRLVRQMVAGALMPGDVARLLAGYDQGWRDGAAIDLAPQPQTLHRLPFLPFQTKMTEESIGIIGRFWRLRQLKERAETAVKQGHRVTLFVFSLTALYHSVRFTSDGYWLQQGGQFGRSVRTMPIFAFWQARNRAKHEIQRVFRQRRIQRIGD